MALEPDELQREAPAFYRLLEDAHDTGYASTQDKDEKEAVDDYLRTKNRSVPTYVEYRDKFFSVGLVV